MRHPRVAVALLSSLLVFVTGCAVGWNHTSDASLERHFSRHQTQFEALRAEVQADSQLTTLQPRAIIYAGKRVEVRDGDLTELERLGLTRERWEHYQKELEDLGLAGVMKGDSDIEFRIDSGSLLNGDSYKGYWYGSTAPYRVRDSLDGYRCSDRDQDKFGNWGVCKPLKRNWYVYLFVNG